MAKSNMVTAVRQLNAKTLALAACALATAFVLPISSVAKPNLDSTHGEWTVFVDEEGGKTCYAVSRPKAQSPNSLSWDPRMFITRGAITNGRDEPSVRAGYTYQDGSSATVSIGSDTFTLFTDNDGAWVNPEDAQSERQLVAAMKAGSTMIVKGTSARGNLTTDTYSLSGVTAAVNRINELCP